jgi:hypothetical protein
MSRVLSRPAIVVFISKFGLFDSYSFTFDVINDTNYKGLIRIEKKNYL